MILPMKSGRGDKLQCDRREGVCSREFRPRQTPENIRELRVLARARGWEFEGAGFDDKGGRDFCSVACMEAEASP